MLNHSFWGFIFNKLFKRSIFIDKKFDKINNDEERRINSKYFGILSIVFVVLGLGLCYPLAYVGVWIIKKAFTTFLGPFTYALAIGNIFIFIGGLFCFMIPITLSIDAIKFAFAQRSVNKKSIGIVSIILSITAFIALLVLQIIAVVLVVLK